jgi:hypothetical protein
MMQVAMENMALALIDTFLGYRPVHFHLGYLFDICNLFCPLVQEIFPRNTEEEIKLFELLSKHISKLRSANLGAIDFLHTELLQRRCRLFQEKASVLIEEEMENEKDRMTPEAAMQVLRRKGLIVSREQAEKILCFLYLIAEVTISKYLKIPP